MSRGYYLTATPAAGIGAAYQLPLSTTLATVGWTRDAAVTQAPESEVGVVYGDNTRKLEPFRLQLTIASTAGERAASDLLAAILAQAASATCVLRYDGNGAVTVATIRRRDYLRCNDFKGEPQIGKLHILPVTLEFLPSKPFWTDRDGNGEYPF